MCIRGQKGVGATTTFMPQKMVFISRTVWDSDLVILPQLPVLLKTLLEMYLLFSFIYNTEILETD